LQAPSTQTLKPAKKLQLAGVDDKQHLNLAVASPQVKQVSQVFLL
jgi:hypothetical protein